MMWINNNHTKWEWSLRKYWWTWLKNSFKRWLYLNYYKLKMKTTNLDSHLPHTGKGRFYSVYRKGDIIQIINHTDDHSFSELRLIPYQPNHGFFLELYKNDKMFSRTIITIDDLLRFELNKYKLK